MPRGDRTGPGGMGRMTGRGAGYCSGNNSPGFANQAYGGGSGMGAGGRGCFGGGRGRRNNFYATGMPGQMPSGGYGNLRDFPAAPAPGMERQALKVQADALQTELEMIRRRLDALDKNE